MKVCSKGMAECVWIPQGQEMLSPDKQDIENQRGKQEVKDQFGKTFRCPAVW